MRRRGGTMRIYLVSVLFFFPGPEPSRRFAGFGAKVCRLRQVLVALPDPLGVRAVPQGSGRPYDVMMVNPSERTVSVFLPESPEKKHQR